MDREQRQRIVDTFCDEWDSSQGDIESNALCECLVGEGMRLDHSELLDSLDDLEGAGLTSLRKPISKGSGRITDVDPVLYEELLIY